MKFLQSEVGDFAQEMFITAGTQGIHAIVKLDMLSCKHAGDDKKVFNSLNSSLEELAKSPQQVAESPFGPLAESASRRALIYLITTLNHCFPDLDFCNVKAEDFCKEASIFMVINRIDSTLLSVIPDYQQKNRRLWELLDHDMQLKECSIYSFNPDSDTDPFTEEFGPSVWSFFYFFYNKKLKRVSFFYAFAIDRTKLSHSMEEDGDSIDVDFGDDDVMDFEL